MLILGSYKYFLIILIILELVVLNLRGFLFYVVGFLNLEALFIYFLVFRVCERVVGLMILVLVIRFRGNDYYKFFSILKFNYDKVFCSKGFDDKFDFF